MKHKFFFSKILHLLFFAIIALPAFTQQKTVEEDVIYLVNGNIIRGKIIEYKSGEYVKIKSYDRNVWVFKEDEIDKIVKEKVVQESDLVQVKKEKGYYNYTGIGILAGSRYSNLSAPFTIQTVNGYQSKGSLYFGGGIGVEFFDEISIPVFADLRYRLLNSEFSPYLFAQGGYSLPLENNWEYRKAKGGPMASIGIGVMFPLNFRTALSFSLSYRYQQLLYVETDSWSGYETKIYEQYNRLGIRFGFLFY